MSLTFSSPTNPTVLIIGGSYAGLHAAEVLANKLPPHWSVTLVERNTHFNHVYSFPRSAVAGKPHWNFIPYFGKINSLNRLTQQFASLSSESPSKQAVPNRIQFINATVTKIVPGQVFLDRMVNLPNSPSPQLFESAHGLSASSSSSTLSDMLDPQSSDFNDSGYGSSPVQSAKLSTSPSTPNHENHPQLSSSKSMEHINYSHFQSSSPRSFQVGWDYLVYALGSHMPAPLQLPDDLPRTKKNGVEFLEAQQAVIENAQKIVIVGGGALGIQYACDIAHRYQSLGRPKNVTLIHSRSTFLPAFKPEIDVKLKEALRSYEVDVVLGERVNLAKLKTDLEAQKNKQIKSVIVESISADKRQWEADLVFVCTGQVPNSSLMAKFCPLAVAGGSQYRGSTGLIRVNRALQISPSDLGPSPIETPTGEPTACECGLTSMRVRREEAADVEPAWSRVFAIGDCIDGFGAIKAGHVGWNQAEVAARNILKLIQLADSPAALDPSVLEQYEPSPPMIKLTLGLNRVVSQLRTPDNPDQIEVSDTITVPAADDSSSRSMWNRYGISDQHMLDGWA